MLEVGPRRRIIYSLAGAPELAHGNVALSRWTETCEEVTTSRVCLNDEGPTDFRSQCAGLHLLGKRKLPLHDYRSRVAVAGISPQQRTHARWYELHNGQDLGKLAATTSTAIVCPLRGSERGLWTNGPLDASVNPTARAGRSKSAVAARPRRTLAESYHTTSISLHQPGFRACASSSCTTRRMPKLYTRCAG